MNLGFTPEEKLVLKRLNTPEKIQDFLDKLPINFEDGGDTCMSPRRVLREKRAHCMEGALLAAAALWLQGQLPLLMDLKTARGDQDHVVTLFRRGKYWGAISKTNHAVLRYRDPIYKNPRELAMSFFHEYFLDSGRKTLLSYSLPFDLRRCLKTHQWTTTEKNLWWLAGELDNSPHISLLPRSAKLRRAGSVEIRAGKVVEWTGTDKKPRRI